MDGNQLMKSVPSAASIFRKSLAGILTSIAAGGLLISSSGCAFTKSTWLNSGPEANHGGQQSKCGSSVSCACPTCALPQNAVAQQAQVTTPGPTPSFQYSHIPAQSLPVQVQTSPGAVPPAESQAWLLIPPGSSMPSDLNRQTQATFPPAQQQVIPPAVPAVPASAAELSQCQKQLEELNQQITSLRETTERSQQAMQVMAVEQKNLQMQNQLLKQRAEKTDRQYLESMESLSQIIGEVVSPPAAAANPAPASSASSKKPNPGSSAILLPSVDESL